MTVLLKLLSPRQKSQIGFGLAIGLPCGGAYSLRHVSPTLYSLHAYCTCKTQRQVTVCKLHPKTMRIITVFQVYKIMHVL